PHRPRQPYRSVRVSDHWEDEMTKVAMIIGALLATAVAAGAQPRTENPVGSSCSQLYAACQKQVTSPQFTGCHDARAPCMQTGTFQFPRGRLWAGVARR